MLLRVSRLPLASKSLVDCWVSVPRLLFGWMEMGGFGLFGVVFTGRLITLKINTQ
jgi:hypothetical protein